ncbi:hypothetical protein [Acidovorax sp. LjRoot117]|uniref:hypothetical protein n=1 Tax=Acidovorax sp. LjRoot117 TaxID=3342255 RepID=UPI003ECFDC2C
MRIELLNEAGEVTNAITASEEFARAYYPHEQWRVAAAQDGETELTTKELVQLIIERLERDQLMPRINREFILGAMKKEAEEAGYTEAQLEAKNKGYRLLKQFDAQIAALRAQL